MRWRPRGHPCIDVRIAACGHVYRHVHRHAQTEMCMEMCTDICVDVCVGVCEDMPLPRSIDLLTHMFHAHVRPRAHAHVCSHVHAHD